MISEVLELVELHRRTKLINKWSKDSQFKLFVLEKHTEFDERRLAGNIFIPFEYASVSQRLTNCDSYADAFLAYMEYQIVDSLHINDLNERQFRIWWLYHLFSAEIASHPNLTDKLQLSSSYTKVNFEMISLFHKEYTQIKKNNHANKES